MGWGDVQEQREGGNASFLSIKDREVKVVHILDDEPYSVKSVFFNAIKKGAIIDPDDNPLEGIKGFDLRTRHAINVYDYADKTVKILMGSNAMFTSIKAVKDEWGDLTQVDLKISRIGAGLDTKYSIVPTAKCRWTDSLLTGQEVFDLPVALAPTSRETVEKYMEGVDPGTEFNPEELEGEEQEAPAEDDVPATSDNEAFVEGEDESPAPSRKPIAAKPPQPKTTANGKSLSRNELIMKINHLAKNKFKYKKPGVWLTDVKRIGGKDKQSMSQLGIEDLNKLYKFVQTVK